MAHTSHQTASAHVQSAILRSVRFADSRTALRMTACFYELSRHQSAGLFAASSYAPASPMSAPPRPLLLRFTLALLGMLLLMAVVFAGLGWMIARHDEWVVKNLGGERTKRVWNWYLGFMANLLPGDQDGDGVCDGAELFRGYDPRNPNDSPQFDALCLSRPEIIAYCGERLSTRWMQGLGVEGVRWPRGFRAVVRATEPVLLSKHDAGPPTRGPLLVPVNERGEVEFDVLAERAFWHMGVVVGRGTDANVQYPRQVPARFPGWRIPQPLPVSIDGGPPDTAFHRGVKWKGSKDVGHTMRWVVPAGWTGDYVIEAAREEDNGNWQPVLTATETETEAKFGRGIYDRDPWRFFSGYTGPLKFRVVPVSATPP